MFLASSSVICRLNSAVSRLDGNDACCKFLQGSNTSEYDWKLHRLAM